MATRPMRTCARLVALIATLVRSEHVTHQLSEGADTYRNGTKRALTTVVTTGCEVRQI